MAIISKDLYWQSTLSWQFFCAAAMIFISADNHGGLGKTHTSELCISDFGFQMWGHLHPECVSDNYFLFFSIQGRIRRVSLFIPLRETDASFFFFFNFQFRSSLIFFFFSQHLQCRERVYQSEHRRRSDIASRCTVSAIYIRQSAFWRQVLCDCLLS